MHVISIQVGGPREIQRPGKTVTTSIYKSPLIGPLRAQRLNLAGDQQSDLSVHGGPFKAVYAYPSEHYAFWREQLPRADLAWGAFGENLTTVGLLEDDLHIGDRFQIGSVEFMVTQPRLPCSKLAMRLENREVGKLFLSSGRTGFYLSVIQEGELEAGQAIRLTGRDPAAIPVSDIVRLHTGEKTNADLLGRASQLPGLPPEWREKFQKRLADLT